MDITNPNDQITTNASSPSNESVDKLIDNNNNTKFCTPSNLPIQITFAGTQSSIINGYTLTTANDTDNYPGRNPKTWDLLGSLDNMNWFTLHSVQNDPLPVTQFTKTTFMFNNNSPYTYYRLNIIETDDGETEGHTFQLAELELLGEFVIPCFSMKSILSVKLPNDVLIQNKNIKNNKWISFENDSMSPLLLTHDHLVLHNNDVKNAFDVSTNFVAQNDDVVDLVSDDGRFIDIKGFMVKTSKRH